MKWHAPSGSQAQWPLAALPEASVVLAELAASAAESCTPDGAEAEQTDKELLGAAVTVGYQAEGVAAAARVECGDRKLSRQGFVTRQAPR